MLLRPEDLVSLLEKVNNFGEETNCTRYKPFNCQGVQVGFISDELQRLLINYPHVFCITENQVSFHPSIQGFHCQSQALNTVLLDIGCEFPCLKGWRNECYQISASYGAQPFFQIERAAAPIFGFRKYGIQINGFVKNATGETSVWFQRRSRSKPTYPGQIDNFVGGGLTEGRGVLETAIKEGEEEAGLTSDVSKDLKSCGCISYLHKSERGIHPLTEFVFDLELPATFVPQNTDGEVEEWILWPVSQIFEILFSKDFKLTGAPVVIDFLIRHGHINIENQPELPFIMEQLHTPLHSRCSQQIAQ